MAILEEVHTRQHEQISAWMQELIRSNRDNVGLERAWSIEGRVLCQQDLPYQEGSVWWDAEMKYARMDIRCDLSNALMLWVIHHELFELLHWETADLYMVTNVRARLPRQFLQYLQEQYRAARNRQIEIHVGRYLGYGRPGHLMEQAVVPSTYPSLYEEKGA